MPGKAHPVNIIGAMGIKVSLIEGMAVDRTFCRQLVERSQGMECVSDHPNARHALEHLSARSPDVVVVDIRLPDLPGHECVARLAPSLPNWDARVAEWATAIREAVTAATGRAPSTTPTEQLGVPGSHWGLLTMFLMLIVPLGGFLTVLDSVFSPGASAGQIVLMSLFILGMAGVGLFLVRAEIQHLHQHRTARRQSLLLRRA